MVIDMTGAKKSEDAEDQEIEDTCEQFRMQRLGTEGPRDRRSKNWFFSLAVWDSIKWEEIRDFCTRSEKTATALNPEIAMVVIVADKEKHRGKAVLG